MEKEVVTIVYEAGLIQKRAYKGTPSQIAYYLRGKKKEGAVYFYWKNSRIYL